MTPLTAKDVEALVLLAARDGLSEGTVTSVELGTIYHVTARRLHSRALIELDGTDRYDRPIYRITPRGTRAVAGHSTPLFEENP